MQCFVYVLKSLRDGNLYIGTTENIKKRLILHNKGKVRSTKSRIPLKLIYIGKFPNRSEAVKRELFLKSPRGYIEKRKVFLKETEIKNI